MICICTGYTEVGYSPLYIYYELLLIGTWFLDSELLTCYGGHWPELHDR